MKKKISAFTLIELLVVIGILVILFAIIFGNVKSALNKAKLTACRDSLKKIHQGVLMYISDNKAFPSSLSDNFLAQYLGTKSDKIKCPGAANGVLGYKINSSILSYLPIESINIDNIFVYEVDTNALSNASVSHSERHNSMSYGITLFGDIVEINSDSKLNYKA